MSVNVKDLITTVDLLIQLTPSALWGEALHASGFFAHVMSTLSEDKASHPRTSLFSAVISLILGVNFGSDGIRSRAGTNCDRGSAGLPAPYCCNLGLPEQTRLVVIQHRT